jgi:hypothetical protein
VRTLKYWFKRPSVFDLLTVWKVKYVPSEDIRELDALCAFAFGEITRFVDSNSDMAVIANQIDKPCICQKEVTYYLIDFPQNLCIPITDEMYEGLKFSDPRGPEYVNSYQVALAIYEICKQNDWTKIGVLTVEPHQILCILILRKLGLRAFAIDCREVKYSRENNQRWVRSRASFTFYSIFTRMFFLYKGWI